MEPQSPGVYIEAIGASSLNVSLLPGMAAAQGASIFKLKTFYWACGYQADATGDCTLGVGGYNPTQADDNPLELAGGPVSFDYARTANARYGTADLNLAVMPDSFLYNTLIFNLTRCEPVLQGCDLFLDTLSVVAYSLDEFQEA